MEVIINGSGEAKKRRKIKQGDSILPPTQDSTRQYWTSVRLIGKKCKEKRAGYEGALIHKLWTTSPRKSIKGPGIVRTLQAVVKTENDRVFSSSSLNRYKGLWLKSLSVTSLGQKLHIFFFFFDSSFCAVFGAGWPLNPGRWKPNSCNKFLFSKQIAQKWTWTAYLRKES